MAKSRICSVDGCGKPTHCKGFCETHYDRMRRRGTLEAKGHAPRGAPEAFLSEALKFNGEECLLWPYARRNKNGYTSITRNGRAMSVSRLVCEAAYGPPPSPKHGALHRCGRGSDGCINQHHLYWGTHLENMDDRNTHGTSNRGERNGLAKLTESDVLEIRRLRGQFRQDILAQRYGVCAVTISEIQTRSAWSWLE